VRAQDCLTLGEAGSNPFRELWLDAGRGNLLPLGQANVESQLGGGAGADFGFRQIAGANIRSIGCCT